jgi:anaerobic selenocysteine-containing dehydrogenase
MRRPSSGGGWKALWYTLRMANRVGWWRLWQAMRRKNTCKTCALGMGGQAGGMRNEAGHWPEVCKKSLQAMVADMQKGLKPEFFAKYSLDQLRALSPRELEHCGRLTAPVYAGPGDTHYRVIDWDEALARLAQQLKATTPDQAFFYASGRSSNEAGFLYQLLGRLYGTNYVNNCSYYCHQASGVGLGQAVGQGTATVALDDVEKCDLFVLIGGNPASNHPRMMRTLMSIRRRKGNVLVINPVREVGLVNFSVPSDVWSMLFGTKIASLYVQPHIGGDIALLLGIAKVVLERKGEDANYLAQATEGYGAYRAQVEATTWDQIVAASGVERETIVKAGEMYLKGGGLRLDDGHHAPRARRRERAGHREPGAAARHGRQAERGVAADPRPFQRARHGVDGRHAATQARDPGEHRAAPRRHPAPVAGPGHDGLHARRP